MNFWSLAISGVDVMTPVNAPQGLSQLEKQIENAVREADVDEFTMGEPRFDVETRRQEYYRYVNVFADLVTSGAVAAKPVHRFIRLVDTKVSLGCDSESVLAGKLNVPIRQPAPMKPATQSELANSLPVLGEDLKVVSAYGGEVTVAAKGNALMLTSA
jgi:hypothetical protein